MPLTTSSLNNYISARDYSLNPSRAYYLQQGTLLPFGEWCYNYIINVNPSLLYDAIPKLGIYIEDNKYYVFSSMGSTNLSFFITPLADYYVRNSVFQTNNVNLLFEYNNASGTYQFNILYDTFNQVRTSYNIGVTNLIMYNYLWDIPWNISGPTLYYYDPENSYVKPDNYNTYKLNIYHPENNPSYWVRNTFYDFNQFYTGTYSSGTFIGNARPYNFTLNNMLSLTGTNNTTGSDQVTFSEELIKKSNDFAMNFRIPSSTKPTSLSKVNQQSSAIKLTNNSRNTKINSLRTTSSGNVTLTTKSLQSIVGINTNTSDNAIIRGTINGP